MINIFLKTSVVALCSMALTNLNLHAQGVKEVEAVEIFPADVKQWRQAGPGHFSIKDGVATSEAGMGLWWYAGRSYANATFDIEFSLPKTDWNSGIFIRFPDPGNDPWIAVRQGYECQLSGDKANKISTGAIYDIQPPSHDNLKKPGEWSKYQITTWENKIIIAVNGELVNVFTTQPNRGDKQGHIGLQNHDPVSRVSFRKVSVREWDKKLTLEQVLDKIGITRADWTRYHNAKKAKKGQTKWYEKMDKGPVWANVFEDHYSGKRRLAAKKGLAIELGMGSDITGLFDTETLRMSSAFQGDIRIEGTPWSGAHGVYTRMGNQKQTIMQTSLKPGWADGDGSFDDGREFPGYGNLAKSHARYRGHFRHGQKTILDYSVLGSRVLEHPSGEVISGQAMMFRQIELAPCGRDRVLLVADEMGAEIKFGSGGKSAIISRPVNEKESNLPQATVGKISVIKDRTEGGWRELSMGAPSNTDLVDRKINKKTYFRVVSNFLASHPRGGDEEGVAVRLNDGLTTRNDDDVERNFFFADKAKEGRLEMNLGEVQTLRRIHLFSNHKGDRAVQNVEVYGASTDKAEAEAANLTDAGWLKIAVYNTNDLGDGGKHGVAILAPKGGELGKFHKLLFICKAGNKGSISQTFFSEIDVYGDKAPAPVLKKIARNNDNESSHFVELKGDGQMFLSGENGTLTLRIPASRKTTYLSIGYAVGKTMAIKEVFSLLKSATPEPRELESFTQGGIALYPEAVAAEIKQGDEKDTWAVDSIGLPVENPWNAMVKPGGLDLFSDGDSAAISTWNGDVWVCKGLKNESGKISWRRFATGLYEPLGLKIVDDVIYVNGRSQITRLHDQNNDGEADWYECFNNDVYVTSNFHEFTFGLDTDPEGDFYIAKAAPVLAGGRGFDEILPHNGTLLKISKDGKKSEVMVTGLRAPGGIGIGPNGEMTTGENEGTWQPCCKLNYVTEKGKFLGVEDTAQELKGQSMHLPLCYFPMRIDNSGGGQVWTPEGSNWGLKAGELVHLSYGKSTLYRVLRQEVDGVMQGGVVRIPIKLNSSAMRARFHSDGSLYVTGFRGWQTNAATQQALHRIRYTGKELSLPDKLEATEKGIYIRFEKRLDAASVSDRFNFNLERWKYIRSSQYGSGEFSIDKPDLEAEKQATLQESQSHRKHDKVDISQSQLLPDGKTIFLRIPDMKPAEQMSIRYKLKFADGSEVESEIVNTVHKLAKDLNKDLSDQGVVTDAQPKDLLAGLLQTIEQAGIVDRRIARLPAQYNDASDAVSDMLGKNDSAYTSTWNGYLDLTERISPVFSLEGSGAAELKVDGKTILKVNGSLDSKKSEKITLDPGAHAFELIYTGANDGSGHVRVLWEEESFPKQSIKPAYFKHQSNKMLLQSLKVRHGRDVFVEQKCTSCHQSGQDNTLPELSYKGPNMKGIGSRVKQEWIAKWLANPHALKPTTTMPAVVDGTTEQGRIDAVDMAAYLASFEADTQLDSIKIQANDAKLGGSHFHNLGCASCHSTPDAKYDAKTNRTPLNNVHQKFSATNLTAFLKKPDKHHASIKMPDFRLSDDEARQLAAFLHAGSEGKATKLAALPKSGDAKRGAELVKGHNCAACHSELPEATVKPSKLSGIITKSWTDHGCAPAHKAGKSPAFNLSDDEREALEAYRSSLAESSFESLKHHSSYDFAERQIQALNCAACHERDGVPALLSSLHSQTQKLLEGVPQDDHHKIDQSRPSLTYTGEMLHSDYLKLMLDGKVKARPRPWLAMRMPAFHSRADMLAKGLGAQHGMAPSMAETANLDPEKIKIGKKIIGTNGGFACTICHANGDSKALAAFEVEGVNFDQVAQRLRPGYYHRWMENPMSITPSTKMPRYTNGNKSGLPDYKGDAEKQFEAVLEYLKSLDEK